MRLIDADALINEIKKDTEKAIEQDDKVGSFWLGYIAGLVIKQPTIQPEERTEKRTETHTCDSIGRKVAIDAVDAIGHIATMPDGDKCIRRSAVKYTLSMLPSAQPEQRWILCDEIMPEEHEWIGTKQFGTTMSDEVYVTFENSKGERFTKHLHFHNGDLSRYDKTHMDAWFKKDYKPIAWMPLPEPYKGEQHE